MSDGIQYAGEFSVDTLTISSAKSPDKIINLTGVGITQFDIYESIFSTSVLGKISIIDDNNLLSNLPILGQERINIEFSTVGLDGVSIKKEFIVYEVIAREELTKGAEIFTLNLVSLEFLQNTRTEISKSFTDTISNIVRNILTTDPIDYPNSKVFIDETSGIRKVNFPSCYPYKAIERLATESVDKNSGSPFTLFFESLEGIHFQSLLSLYKNPIAQEFNSGDATVLLGEGQTKSNDIEDEMQRIIGVSVPSQNNMIVNTKIGMLSSKMIEYNIFTKSYETTTFNYFDDFGKYERISGNSVEDNPVYIDTNIPHTQKRVSDFPAAAKYLHTVSSYKEKDAEHYSKSKQMLYEPNKISSTLLHRNSRYSELQGNTVVTIQTHGISTLRAGRPVIFNKKVVGRDHNDEEFSSLYRGKFLISKARHTFDIPNKRYSTILTLVKDSSPTAH